MPDPSGATAFHDFEHAGWERAAPYYTDAFGPLTVQAAPALLDAVGATRGTVMLDVASGPGLGRRGAERGVRVTGVDFASTMVDQARRGALAIAFREGDASRLAFAMANSMPCDDFGMLHLARPDTPWRGHRVCGLAALRLHRLGGAGGRRLRDRLTRHRSSATHR
jgi:SAM-dependent methyltransferase